jgi:type I restriction enzyme, S subunit
MDKDIFLQKFGHLAQGPDGVKKLRDLILQLAVQGKLVEQNPNDEQASVLLEKILATKKELIKRKVHKKLKNLPEIDDEEISYQIPNTWLWERLGNLSNYGETLKAECKDISDKDFWILELEDIEKKTSRLLKRVAFSKRKFRSSKNRFQSGDVLYGKLRPYLDKVVVANEPGVCTTEIIPIRAYDGISSEFLRWVLKSPAFINYANNSTHGMNLPRMGTDKARLALLPLPPLAEQKRIVAKVDELMSLCDELEATQNTHQDLKRDCVASTLHHLSEATDSQEINSNWSILHGNFNNWFDDLETVKNLRASILQLAVQGKLVEQDPDDEPASVLLDTIAKERESIIATGIINRLKSIPKILDDDIPFTVPPLWCWGRYNELLRFIDYRGKTPPKVENGTPLITAKNVKKGFISRRPHEYITEKYYHKWMTRGFPEIGDILLTVEAPLGNVALVDIEDRFALAQRVICLQPWDKNALDSKFILYVILSPLGQSQLIEKSSGMTATGIKSSRLKLLALPVPPLAEQKRIVAKVDELMAMCDQLETQIKTSQTLNQNLMASLSHHMTVC